VQSADDFERAELGPNWIDRLAGGVAGIVAGRDLGAMRAPGNLSVDWVGASFPADQFGEIVVAAGKDPNLMFQLHVRRQSGTFVRYGFHYNIERSPAVWELKYDGVPAAETRILGTSTVAGPAAGDVIRFEIRGRVLSGFKNGQPIVTATDNAPSAILTTGAVGISVRPALGTSPRYPTSIAASWKGGPLP
jgi:hypothetical protein